MVLNEMKRLYIYLLIFFFVGSFFVAPFFVLASNICYVDEKSDDGDGSSDKPYKKIAKALDDDCGEIRIAKGTYEEDVKIKKSLKIKGDNRDGVVIDGKVTMDDKTELSKVTVMKGGVELVDNADADIESVKVKDSILGGIVTNGGGKLTLDNVIVSGNNKGMYIKYGKEVRITNCKIYNNKEEGLDIRANVSGAINNNEIYSNGESGIEVILGKSELNIFNNNIKKNGSSGIAAQFYSDTDKLGDVNIKNNVITGNNNYGLDCRTPSGGDGRPKGYWMDSMDITSNKIVDNKKKDISSGCKFDEDKILDATMTKKQREEQKLALEEKVQKKTISVEEKKELEEIKSQEEEDDNVARIGVEEKNNIDLIYAELETLFKDEEIKKEKIENKNKFLKFIMGEDYQEIKNIQDNLTIYDEKIELIEDKKGNVADVNILNEIDNQILVLKEKRENNFNFIESKKETFSILGKIFMKKIFNG